MARKLPRLTAREAISLIEKYEFFFVRQGGSHKLYRNKEGKRINIPFHGDKILHPKYVKEILSILNLTAEDF